MVLRAATFVPMGSYAKHRERGRRDRDIDCSSCRAQFEQRANRGTMAA
jgi:hypothetical protein